jgi:putative tryptophan/tyrosine transport system substrate-binding protein
MVTGQATLERITEAMLSARATLQAEYEKLHKAVVAFVREDAVCRRLMTVPGVGPVVAVTFKSAVLREVGPSARAMGLQIQVVKASTIREINAAFATFVHDRPDALFVGTDPFFNSRRTQLVHLSTRHAIPTSYPARDYAEVGGLMSYGANIADAWRQCGSYTGRILKGAKPSDLPVVQSSKFELVINVQTATMLGLTVPDKLLVAADEVIE